MRSTGSWYEVKDLAEGQLWKCRLKGKFKLKGFKVTNPIAVGDRVGYLVEDETEGTGIILDIQPRHNYIIRQSVHKAGHAHLLASNLDQAILIVTLDFPRTSLGFIDRFLVTAESFRIPVVLIFNKKDLLSAEALDFQQELMDEYERLGYRCLSTSALDQEGLADFDRVLDGKVSLLAGHSGVGKSSLINAIAPHLDLRTQQVSTFANKGVHTTTFAEMFELRPHTYLIDSPGIKELGLVEIEPSEISHYFPEMRALLGSCRFHDCLHINEPGCAVKTAVEEGHIMISRFENYLSMVGNQDNRR